MHVWRTNVADRAAVVTPLFNHFTPAGEETSEFEEDDEDGEDGFDDGPAQRGKFKPQLASHSPRSLWPFFMQIQSLHVPILSHADSNEPAAADALPPAKPARRFSSKAMVRPVLDDGEDTDEYDEDEDDAVWSHSGLGFGVCESVLFLSHTHTLSLCPLTMRCPIPLFPRQLDFLNISELPPPPPLLTMRSASKIRDDASGLPPPPSPPGTTADVLRERKPAPPPPLKKPTGIPAADPLLWNLPPPPPPPPGM